MSLLRALRQRWSEISLGYDLEHGRRLRGRVDADRPSPGIAPLVTAVGMPVRVTIEATVIRADGTRERQGIIADSVREVSAASPLRRAAARQQRRRS
jgi:hypothetical protein